MDQGRFDSLTRSLAMAKSRRGFLGALLAIGAGLTTRGAAGAQCANVSCKNNPGRCGPGCVCCVYGNRNSRCLAPGSCNGMPTCPSGQVSDPVAGCVAPTTTTTTTAAPIPPGGACTTSPQCSTGFCVGGTCCASAACGPCESCATGACVSACTGGKTCEGGVCVCPIGQTDCAGTCSDCPCGQVKLCNGSCATPCSGVSCAGCFACFRDVSGASYCQSPGLFGACQSDCDCDPGQFCASFPDSTCVPLCQGT